jgi:hypothetical protein
MADGHGDPSNGDPYQPMHEKGEQVHIPVLLLDDAVWIDVTM